MGEVEEERVVIFSRKVEEETNPELGEWSYKIGSKTPECAKPT